MKIDNLSVSIEVDSKEIDESIEKNKELLGLLEQVEQSLIRINELKTKIFS